MSCYSCGSAFGLFKKEFGCKNCGYAFCKDCLTKKAEIPKLKNEKHKVCLKCYNILTGQVQPENKNVKYSPPEALRKRLAKLEQKAHSPERFRAKPSPAECKIMNTTGMSKEDIAIAVRLQKLKESRKQSEPPPPSEKQIRERLDKLGKDPNTSSQPSEQEMAQRLAKLKGQDPSSINRPHVFQTEHRTEAQQVEDLLLEICEEVDIDSHQINYAEDVGNRLDRLRALHDTPAELQNNLNSPDTKHEAHYTKNIPDIDNDYNSASGENVDWSEMNHLIREVATELEVDAARAIQGLKQDKDLWNRLAKLREKKETKIENLDEHPNCGICGSPENEEEQEEEACKNIIRELLEESRLEYENDEAEITGKTKMKSPSVTRETNVVRSSQMSTADYQPDPDELPFCCLCNNDATLRCIGCSGDLYCKSCYKEFHKRESHLTRPFHASAK